MWFLKLEMKKLKAALLGAVGTISSVKSSTSRGFYCTTLTEFSLSVLEAMTTARASKWWMTFVNEGSINGVVLVPTVGNSKVPPQLNAVCSKSHLSFRQTLLKNFLHNPLMSLDPTHQVTSISAEQMIWLTKTVGMEFFCVFLKLEYLLPNENLAGKGVGEWGRASLRSPFLRRDKTCDAESVASSSV